MRGPLPRYRPEFSSTFLEQAQEIAWQRTVKDQLRQRATLVLLLHQQPPLPSVVRPYVMRCGRQATKTLMWSERRSGSICSGAARR